MSKIDFTKYESVVQIDKDIRSVAIQGATNVAIATFEGVKLFLRGHHAQGTYEEFLSEIRMVAEGLANARPNEPLAKNGVKYIYYHLEQRFDDLHDSEKVREVITDLADEYLHLIKSGKDAIIEKSTAVMEDVDEILTHCHSSTAESVIIARNKVLKGDLDVVCTETRPLYQGRITAKNLLGAGVKTTMIADSAAESFIIGRGTHGIDVIFIGADEVLLSGDAINKVGSWGIAFAANHAKRPLYVVTSLLKVDISVGDDVPGIEMRESDELWEDAPEGLKMVNPSFELIDSEFITGFITEAGIVKPEEVSAAAKGKYPWLFA